MDTLAASPVAIAQPTPRELALSGAWTARGIGAIAKDLYGGVVAANRAAQTVLQRLASFRNEAAAQLASARRRGRETPRGGR